MQALVSGSEICAVFTLFNGLVMARSAFAHSGPIRIRHRLRHRLRHPGTGLETARPQGHLPDHLFPGRWEDVRPPTEQEISATCVAGITITEASAKVSAEGPRTGPATWTGPRGPVSSPPEPHTAPAAGPIAKSIGPVPGISEATFLMAAGVAGKETALASITRS